MHSVGNKYLVRKNRYIAKDKLKIVVFIKRQHISSFIVFKIDIRILANLIFLLHTCRSIYAIVDTITIIYAIK